MRATLTAIVLSIVGGAACAQPANEAIKGLESCFQGARLADTICSNATNNPVQRLDCFQKARAAQLECLQHVPSGMSAGFATPEIPTAGNASPATPPGTVRPEMPKVVSPGMPTGNAATEVPSGSVLPKMPAGTVPSEMPNGPVSVNEPTGVVSSKSPAEAVPAEMPTSTVSQGTPAGNLDIPAKPSETNWFVSETTSPVDYSPLITAAIRSTSSEKDAPNTFTIRCRQLRTDLMVRTEGTWRVSRNNDAQVDFQINDQSSVRLKWTASADGKTASYNDNAVEFLQSLPEGAGLKINVFDGPGLSHDATFQLIGLDAIRKKMAVACKWAPTANKTSSGKR
jgi:hypothetical protein